MITRTGLSQQDVTRLLGHPSGKTRAATAAKIARDFSSERLGPLERQLALEIFRLMVKDAEVRVREALALHLKESPALPREVALSLARDVNSVALPVLEHSAALTDEDLVQIVRSEGSEKLVAIAGRATVSEAVSSALVETDDEDAVSTLVANEGAEIPEPSLERVIEHFPQSERVHQAMVRRAKLPVIVAERLVNLVSEELRRELVAQGEVSSELATELILHSRERATITLSEETDADELDGLIGQLHEGGRLTSSIVLRALCMGDLRFFESAVATRAGVSVMNTRNLIHDSGPLGLKAIYDRAGLPEGQYPAVRAAIDVARETDYDGREYDRERYSRRMIERILTQYGDLGVEFESDDLEYLLAKMAQLTDDAREPH